MERRRRRFRFSYLLFLLLFVFIFDLGFFAASLLPAPQSPDSIEHVDLIAVLTGGQRRVREALNFLLQDRGKYLFISGVAKGSDINEIFRANKVDPPPADLKARIYLGAEAGSTLENAEEIRVIAERLQVKSLLLVTSTYHLQRAKRLLEAEVARSPTARNLKIFAYPVESPNFDRNDWWRSPTAWSILLWEYFKFLPYRFGI